MSAFEDIRIKGDSVGRRLKYLHRLEAMQGATVWEDTISQPDIQLIFHGLMRTTGRTGGVESAELLSRSRSLLSPEVS